VGRRPPSSSRAQRFAFFRPFLADFFRAFFFPCPFVSSCPSADAATAFLAFELARLPRRIFDAAVETLADVCLRAFFFFFDAMARMLARVQRAVQGRISSSMASAEAAPSADPVRKNAQPRRGAVLAHLVEA
jgi:hypothetical protein